jgi:hypothetical protein
MAHDHPDPQPLRPSRRAFDRTWPLEYEPDALGPDIQLRLRRVVDGRVSLTIDGAHGLIFGGFHLTKLSARSLRHALDHAIEAWEQLDQPALLSGFPAPHREEESP